MPFGTRPVCGQSPFQPRSSEHQARERSVIWWHCEDFTQTHALMFMWGYTSPPLLLLIRARPRQVRQRQRKRRAAPSFLIEHYSGIQFPLSYRVLTNNGSRFLPSSVVILSFSLLFNHSPSIDVDTTFYTRQQLSTNSIRSATSRRSA